MSRKSKTNADGSSAAKKTGSRKPPKEVAAPTETQVDASSEIELQTTELTPEQTAAVNETVEAMTEPAQESAQAELIVESAQESAQAELIVESAPVVQKTEGKFTSKNPDDVVMDLESAAGGMVDGYKESWLPAIKAKARSMGMGDKATKREWRGVFLAWGGQGILR